MLEDISGRNYERGLPLCGHGEATIHTVWRLSNTVTLESFMHSLKNSHSWSVTEQNQLIGPKGKYVWNSTLFCPWAS